ncbi:unnamed protein product [Psylliodes chrysocephalus]|uniref:DUF4780 domain-containing protein n=1 Tax=Psylliodes chrysocephalus TaxID=3402493 RepID=A0A9P0CR03_9CUCU|nr:unnamed protein product [Psylliodes chrysocephala]
MNCRRGRCGSKRFSEGTRRPPLVSSLAGARGALRRSTFFSLATRGNTMDSNTNIKPEEAGRQRSPPANETGQLRPPPTNEAEQQTSPHIKKHRRKRISGAEAKRRKKAKLQASNDSATAARSKFPPFKSSPSGPIKFLGSDVSSASARGQEHVATNTELPPSKPSTSGPIKFLASDVSSASARGQEHDATNTELSPSKPSSSGPIKFLDSNASSASKRGQERDATMTKKTRFDTSSENTHREGKKPRWKHKVMPRMSYKDAATSHLNVSIIDRENPYGKITAERVILVKKALMGELDKTILSASGSKNKPPTFRSWTHFGEIIRVTCDDDLSLEWLKSTVPSLNTWEGASLVVGRVDGLPKLTKSSLWVPGEAQEDLEKKEIVLRRLEAQNPNLNVAKWCIFHHEAKVYPEGHLFVFGIGDEDMETLKAKSMRMSYGFTSLNVRSKLEKETVARTREESSVGDPPPP